MKSNLLPKNNSWQQAAKYCDEFFPTPTDIGFCLTKNLKINDVMNYNIDYDQVFESSKRKSKQTNEKIDGGSLWSRNTLVILTDGKNELRQSYPRTLNGHLNEIIFQLHSPKELAKIHLSGSDYVEELAPLRLKAGNEYFIKVTATGQTTSINFKKLDFNERNCYTDEELAQSKSNTIFKINTEKNCQYECHVILAHKECKCIPWDFMHNSKISLSENVKIHECDVFGRTCFFKTMKNLSESQTKFCDHCIKECDYLNYYKEVITNNLIQEKPIVGTLNGKYLSYEIPNRFGFKHHKAHITGGSKLFIDFFEDNNGTLTDKGSRDTFDYLMVQEKEKYIRRRLSLYNDIIIIHLRFEEPQIDWIDTKYTLLDQFSSFGGKFGIFAQLTGCSLLGLLNICFLIFKILFASYHQ